MKQSFKQLSTKKFLYGLLVVSGLLLSTASHAWDRGSTQTFALLPEGSSYPEAVTADSEGQLYVSTFGSGEIHHYSRHGRLLGSIKVSPSSGLLLDLAFHPDSGNLLVVDFASHQLLQVDPVSGYASVFSQIPGELALPNALTFDRNGYVYVSDSGQATIWRIEPTGGAAQAWLTHKLLATSNYPPFGANGLAFNNDYSIMYVANTGQHTVIKVPLNPDGLPATPVILSRSVTTPDGLIVDEADNILVASNHANQVIRLDPDGVLIGVYGDFNGISEHGIVQGLLSPSDLVKLGKDILVSNFALDVARFGLPEHATSVYTTRVKRHSISRLRLDDEGDHQRQH